MIGSIFCFMDKSTFHRFKHTNCPANNHTHIGQLAALWYKLIVLRLLVERRLGIGDTIS